LLYSCEYEPEKIHETSINMDVQPPQIQTIQMDLVGDVIYLTENRHVNYQFKSNNQPIEWIEFILDGRQMVTTYSNPGQFYLDYNELSGGAHSLRMNIYTATGDGSIADGIGGEAFIFTRTWTIIAVK
jgi:hypothetical protein